MLPETDKQTLQDLNIFPENKNELSIYSLYNQNKTSGGRKALYNMLGTPLNDVQIINYRLEAIKFIQDHNIEFEFNFRKLNFIELYLNHNKALPSKNTLQSVITWLSNKIKPDSDYFIVLRGIEDLKEICLQIVDFAEKLASSGAPGELRDFIEEVNLYKKQQPVKHFLSNRKKHISIIHVNSTDVLIRKEKREVFKKLLSWLYRIEALICVAEVSKKLDFVIPLIKQNSEFKISIEGIRHPFLDEAIKNDIAIKNNENLCFISGPNMAGKSTFLKSMGLCMYLAHIGFPVPADKMDTVIFNKLFTTINISDDINRGYSHFYSEVKRVKEIVKSIKENRKVFIIFDELFRGTNVKDAFEATLAVASRFHKINNCMMFLSSHLVEVGEKLEPEKKVLLKYFESTNENNKITYSYKLNDGISNERLGMKIIREEGIIKELDAIIQQD